MCGCACIPCTKRQHWGRIIRAHWLHGRRVVVPSQTSPYNGVRLKSNYSGGIANRSKCYLTCVSISFLSLFYPNELNHICKRLSRKAQGIYENYYLVTHKLYLGKKFPLSFLSTAQWGAVEFQITMSCRCMVQCSFGFNNGGDIMHCPFNSFT